MLYSVVSNSVGTTAVTVQTVPASDVHIILGIIVRNKLNANVGARVYVQKSGGATIDLIGTSPLMLPYEILTWEGKLFLTAGDMIKVVSDTASSLDIMTSYTEEVNS